MNSLLEVVSLKNLIKDLIYYNEASLDSIIDLDKRYREVITIVEDEMKDKVFSYNVRKETEFTELGSPIVDYILVINIKNSNLATFIKIIERVINNFNGRYFDSRSFIFVVSDDTLKEFECMNNFRFINCYSTKGLSDSCDYCEIKEFNYNKDSLKTLIDIGYIELIYKLNQLCKPE